MRGYIVLACVGLLVAILVILFIRRRAEEKFVKKLKKKEPDLYKRHFVGGPHKTMGIPKFSAPSRRRKSMYVMPLKTAFMLTTEIESDKLRKKLLNIHYMFGAMMLCLVLIFVGILLTLYVFK